MNTKQKANEAADPTTTAAFKAWFKGSKVVDVAGKPLRVYHGSGTRIRRFSAAFTGKGNDENGTGFYFTTRNAEAEGYTRRRSGTYDVKPGGESEPTVHEVYLCIRKPLDAHKLGHLTLAQATKMIRLCPDEREALTNWGDIDYDGLDVVRNRAADQYASVKGSTLLHVLTMMYNDFYNGDHAAWASSVEAVLGYDGVVAKVSSESTHWVAWFPRQIKSVTSHFNRDSEDIDERALREARAKRVSVTVKPFNASGYYTVGHDSTTIGDKNVAAWVRYPGRSVDVFWGADHDAAIAMGKMRGGFLWQGRYEKDTRSASLVSLHGMDTTPEEAFEMLTELRIAFPDMRTLYVDPDDARLYARIATGLEEALQRLPEASRDVLTCIGSLEDAGHELRGVLRRGHPAQWTELRGIGPSPKDAIWWCAMDAVHADYYRKAQQLWPGKPITAYIAQRVGSGWKVTEDYPIDESTLDERNDREHIANLSLAYTQLGNVLKDALAQGKGKFTRSERYASWSVELHDDAKYKVGEALGLGNNVMFVTRMVADKEMWERYRNRQGHSFGEVMTVRVHEDGNNVLRMYLTLFLYPHDVQAITNPDTFYNMADQRYWSEFLFPQYWKNNRYVIIHELTHAFDQLRIKAFGNNRNWKGKSAETRYERYLSDPLEFNAVFLEVADYMSEFYSDKPIPGFKDFLEHMLNPFAPNNLYRISKMDRWKKKVVTRAYQLWNDLRAAKR